MREITKRQTEVLNFIKQFVADHHFPPTIREIGTHFEISPKAAHDHVKALKKKGFIHWDGYRSRAIEILDEEKSDPEFLEIPLLGNVAAGLPLLAEENLEKIIKFPSDNLKIHKEYFALRVHGDSMINAGIHDGDVAIIQLQNTAVNGNIIVARVNDDAVTLKRFYKESNRVRLEAENPDYQPIYTQNVKILGKLSCLVRNYD